MVKQNYPPPPPLVTPQTETEHKKKKKNGKKVDLVSKTITLHLNHTFWYILFFGRSFYVDYHVKFPNFTFEGGP